MALRREFSFNQKSLGIHNRFSSKGFMRQEMIYNGADKGDN